MISLRLWKGNAIELPITPTASILNVKVKVTLFCSHYLSWKSIYLFCNVILLYNCSKSLLIVVATYCKRLWHLIEFKADDAKISMYSKLPEEIVEEILLRLPADSVKICRLVCKSWFDLIGDPSFINKHLRHVTTKNSKFS